MAVTETIKQSIHNAQQFTQLSGSIVALRAETYAILQALGVQQAYNLSRKQQGVVTDAFAANLAEVKQRGWFGIDTTLAHLRGDTTVIAEKNDKKDRLIQTASFYARRTEKKMSHVNPTSRAAISAALESARFAYNIVLRGDTKQFTSIDRLQVCRRLVKTYAARTLLPQAA